MKTLFRWLLILIFATAQIPLLPLCALVIAQVDNGHQICLSEQDGVVKIVLRHDQGQARHIGALNALIRLEANQNDAPDHEMNFLHSKLSIEESRASCKSHDTASCEAWVEGDEIIALIGEQPPVVEEIPLAARPADDTHVPLGLAQTVILV